MSSHVMCSPRAVQCLSALWGAVLHEERGEVLMWILLQNVEHLVHPSTTLEVGTVRLCYQFTQLIFGNTMTGFKYHLLPVEALKNTCREMRSTECMGMTALHTLSP